MYDKATFTLTQLELIVIHTQAEGLLDGVRSDGPQQHTVGCGRVPRWIHSTTAMDQDKRATRVKDAT